MEDIFNEAYKLNLWKKFDIELARILVSSNQPVLMLIVVCLSANISYGHSCLNLILLKNKNFFNGKELILSKKIYKRIGKPNIKDLINLLISSSIVSDGKKKNLLVLENNKLYFYKIWKYECIVTNFILNFNKYKIFLTTNDLKKIKILINRNFLKNNKIINWQKIAIFISVMQPITFIFGNPGTGKTYIIAKLLKILIELNNNNLKIKIAAPTGKAATKLNESLWLNLNKINLTKLQKKCIPNKGITLHNLLKINFNKNKLRKTNLLNIDVLIIDEASMIDLQMMAHLIIALPKHIRVVFLGDFYQLLPINVGFVIGDIYKYTEFNLIKIQERNLNYLNKFNLLNNELILFKNKNKILNKLKSCMINNLCFLNKNYRFNKKSGIKIISDMIKIGDFINTINLLTSNKILNINYLPLNNKIHYFNMINLCIKEYKKYIYMINNEYKPLLIFKKFKKFQLLCALNKGPFGVAGLNNYIEKYLKTNNFIENKTNYIGKPIIITKNSLNLNLYNGDIGLLIKKINNISYVCFNSSNNTIRYISLSQIPEYKTCFAITIHKSQGSEFHHVALILPNKISKILTRELIYTAITRAKTILSICATKEIIKYAILNKINRYSGLIKRLKTNII